MSPEQARGASIDERADIWAFGCCLFEALSGSRAFPGDSVTDILAAVIKTEPEWGRIPSSTPWRVRDVLRRCLRKDKRQRFRSIGDVRIELGEAPPSDLPEGRRGNPKLAAAMALFAVAGFGLALWALLRNPVPDPMPVSRWSISLPPGGSLFQGWGTEGDLGQTSSVVISPDGRQIAYIVQRGGATELFLRAADALEAEAVDAGARAAMPFFSPDSRFLGFRSASNKLMKVSVKGGAPVIITDPGRRLKGDEIRGASWGADGSIVFTSGAAGGLYRVSANGGEPALLAEPRREMGERTYRFPDVLPGEKAVVFTLVTTEIESFDEASIAVLSLDTGEIRTLLEGGSSARFSPTGHLVYVRAGSLLAVPFDPIALEVTGTPVRVVDGVAHWPTMGSAEFSLSREGSLLYAPGAVYGTSEQVVSVDRAGVATPLVRETSAFYHVRLSPDGRALALSIDNANMSLWVYDVGRGALTRLVSGANNWQPVWHPDGRRLTFSSDRKGVMNLFSAAADGSGEVQRLTHGGRAQTPESWTPDGRTVAFSELSEKTGDDIWLLEEGADVGRPFLGTPANEGGASFSPSGRSMAYQSDESGRWEIYVCAYPGPGARRQVSIDGGTDPVWDPAGRELFYRSGNKMMAVTVESEPLLSFGRPRLLFESPAYHNHLKTYDVTANGGGFVMIEGGRSLPPPTELVIVQNWSGELRQLVPEEN
jgi:serine/threonine-protein kinase